MNEGGFSFSRLFDVSMCVCVVMFITGVNA